MLRFTVTITTSIANFLCCLQTLHTRILNGVGHCFHTSARTSNHRETHVKYWFQPTEIALLTRTRKYEWKPRTEENKKLIKRNVAHTFVSDKVTRSLRCVVWLVAPSVRLRRTNPCRAIWSLHMQMLECSWTWMQQRTVLVEIGGTR